MDTDNLIKPGMFLFVNTDTMEENNLKAGQYVYTAGLRAIPVDEDNPYLQLIHVVVCPVVNNSVVTDEYILSPPDNFTIVSLEEAELLHGQLEIDMADKHEIN